MQNMVQKTLDVKLGEEVGYKYKGSPEDSISEMSRLLYVSFYWKDLILN